MNDKSESQDNLSVAYDNFGGWCRQFVDAMPERDWSVIDLIDIYYAAYKAFEHTAPLDWREEARG